MTHQKIPDARDIDGEGWISWGGGTRPVAADTLVDVWFRCEPEGETAPPSAAGDFRWSHFGWMGDIIAYRVVESAPPSPAAVEHVERGEDIDEEAFSEAFKAFDDEYATIGDRAKQAVRSAIKVYLDLARARPKESQS